MVAPTLTKEQVSQLLPTASDIGDPLVGGQKIVFPCSINGLRCVVKFLSPKHPGQAEGLSIQTLDEVTARAQREVEIMRQCDTPHLVKLGPLPLTRIEHDGEQLLFFTEELVPGRDLQTVMDTDGAFSPAEVVCLGRGVLRAIQALWEIAKIHRDIKPRNIIRRDTGEYVLLDLGLAFDIVDESLTLSGAVAGTPPYFSPEQMDIGRKRQLDFRSDIFSLGVVMYEVGTLQHPFIVNAQMGIDELAHAIRNTDPVAPHEIRPEFGEGLGNLILRCLAKKPHLRFRKTSHLDEALASVGADRRGLV